MSNTNIGNITSQIRNETKKHGNTKKRVADVLDEINNFKADLVDGKVPLEQLPPINVDVPENLSEFNNDTNFITIEDVPTLPRLHQVATSGDYNDLENIPDIPVQVNTDWNSTSGLSQLLNKPLSFPPTAHKHSWDDIDDKPVIPAPVDITSKVDKTTTTISSPDATNKYVYLHSETNTTPKRMLAGDLGKNIANSKLTSVANAGLDLGDNWQIDTKGKLFKILGLINKSSDQSYDKLLMENSNGDIALSDGKNILKSIPSLLDEQERTAWKTAMNGGWTTASMSIGSVFPNMIKRSLDYIVIVIRGSNLNINPASSIISLINNSTLQEIIIPNSNVNYASGQSGELTFWMKPSDFVNGNYSIKIFNGVATIVTAEINTIQITDVVNNVNTSGLTWSKLTYTPGEEETSLITTGGVMQYQAKNTNDNTRKIVASAKSSPIIQSNKNFTLKGSVKLYAAMGLFGGVTVGLMSSTVANSLLDASILSAGLILKGGSWVGVGIIANGSQAANSDAPGGTIEIPFIITKRGNMAYIQISYETPFGGTGVKKTVLQSKTINDNEELSLVFQGMSGNSDLIIGTASIEEFYTN